MRNIFTGNSIQKGLIVLSALFVFNSCKKGSDATDGTNTNQKPKVGTIWTYRYYTYNPPAAGGGIHTTEVLNYKAKAEVVLGGEKWLNIVNMATDTTVFILNEKTGGLYQYTNNSSNLFCKNPAVLNETYTSFNNGSNETFTVKAVKDTLLTGIGGIPTNYYEGVKSGQLIDMLWYNEYAWVVQRHFFLYTTNPPMPFNYYYRYSSLYLDDIQY
jgi:hypothetical protein